MVGIGRLLWNLIDIEGTGLKCAPYRGRKIVQRPAPDLANRGAASVNLRKSPCNCSSSWRLHGGLQLYWEGILETTSQNDKSIAYSRLLLNFENRRGPFFFFSFSNLVFRFFPAKKKNQTLIMEETKKKKTKPVRLIPLTTSKKPLSQRTVPELFSSSGSSQVKASTPTGVKPETSKKLPQARTSLLKEKPLANQEAIVTAASSIKSRIPLKFPSCQLRIHQLLRTLVARLSGALGKITNEIRGGSS